MSFEFLIFVINILIMSEKEMNSYRLTSLEEPTDEMLATLMKEVAEEAKRKSEEAHKKFFQEIKEYIRKQRVKWGEEYNVNFTIDKDLYDKWINGEFTKVVLGAKNRNQLLKAKIMAEDHGMNEGIDLFLIRDNCNTELEPEEVDENGVGRTLTCIGFRPMESEIIDKIGKKYHLYI